MRTLFLSNLMSLDGFFARIVLRLTDVPGSIRGS